jgi:hypothetical protein
MVSVNSIGGTPATWFTVQDVIYDTAQVWFTYGSFYTDDPDSDDSTNFVDLPVGNYIITVKNLDTVTRKSKGTDYVNEAEHFRLNHWYGCDVTCFSGTDGSVNVTL